MPSEARDAMVLECGGFGIHAGVTVARGDLIGGEKLVRYLVRPAFAEDQI